jgi:hypothetical protein
MSEKCSSCEQMKKENTLARKALVDTNKNYVEVVNENLALKRELEETRSIAFPPPSSHDDSGRSPFYGMPLCPHKIQFGCNLCNLCGEV